MFSILGQGVVIEIKTCVNRVKYMQYFFNMRICNVVCILQLMFKVTKRLGSAVEVLELNSV